jgi:hypothetical protein
MRRRTVDVLVSWVGVLLAVILMVDAIIALVAATLMGVLALLGFRQVHRTPHRTPGDAQPLAAASASTLDGHAERALDERGVRP